MNIMEKIEKQYKYYQRGLLTNLEMLQGIAEIVNQETPVKIEYRKGSKGPWKTFKEELYSKEEAAGILEVLNYNSLDIDFRAVNAI